MSIAIACGLVAGCDIINPAEPVPSYIAVETIPLATMPGEGSSASKITDAWVRVDGNLIGAYSLPGTIPILAAGATEIEISPGIRANGITSLSREYPFYTSSLHTPNLAVIEVHTLNPTTRYRPNIEFVFIDDFEQGTIWLEDLDGDSTTFLEITQNAPFEGNSSGLITLDGDRTNVQIATTGVFEDLPLNGTPVYLEMNYKNNVEFSVGLVGLQPNLPAQTNTILILRARDDWNKIYIDITESLQVSRFPAYQIFIAALHNSELVESIILLDNIKLLHFSQ